MPQAGTRASLQKAARRRVAPVEFNFACSIMWHICRSPLQFPRSLVELQLRQQDQHPVRQGRLRQAAARQQRKRPPQPALLPARSDRVGRVQRQQRSAGPGVGRRRQLCDDANARVPPPSVRLHCLNRCSPHEPAPQVEHDHRIVGLRHPKVAIAIHHDACNERFKNEAEAQCSETTGKR